MAKSLICIDFVPSLLPHSTLISMIASQMTLLGFLWFVSFCLPRDQPNTLPLPGFKPTDSVSISKRSNHQTTAPCPFRIDLIKTKKNKQTIRCYNGFSCSRFEKQMLRSFCGWKQSAFHPEEDHERCNWARKRKRKRSFSFVRSIIASAVQIVC